MVENIRNTGMRLRISAAWLSIIKHTLNPLSLQSAGGKHGPFAVIRHVGPITGTVYEAPIIVAHSAAGFVAELTYKPNVAWYQSAIAAERCTILRHGESFEIDQFTPLAAKEGLAAFGPPRSWVLQLLRRRGFFTLHVSTLHVSGEPAGRC